MGDRRTLEVATAAAQGFVVYYLIVEPARALAEGFGFSVAFDPSWFAQVSAGFGFALGVLFRDYMQQPKKNDADKIGTPLNDTQKD